MNKKRISIMMSLIIMVMCCTASFGSEIDIGQEKEITFGNSVCHTVSANPSTPSQSFTGDFIARQGWFGNIGPGIGTSEVGYVRLADDVFFSISYDERYEDKGKIPFQYGYSHDNWKDVAYTPNIIGVPTTAEKEKRIHFTADSSNNFTVSAPKLDVEGFNFINVGWVCEVDFTPQGSQYVYIEAGKPYTFKESTIRPRHDSDYWFFPVLEISENEIIEPFTYTEGGHTVNISINRTPQYTGKKIRATDIFESFELDGKSIEQDKIKLSVSKGVNAYSKIKIRLKKVKGIDKATNNILKGMNIGEVTIMPFIAKEYVPNTKEFTKEGQITGKVKVKTYDNPELSQDVTIKNPSIIVSKKGRYSSNKTKGSLIKPKFKRDWNCGGVSGSYERSDTVLSRTYEALLFYGNNVHGIVMYYLSPIREKKSE